LSVATVSREELYEQVWARPMMKVAADYGITGTALKKACTRHQIPTPEQGYWAKLEHGKPVKKQPLAKLTDDRLAQVHIGEALQHLPDWVRQSRVKARARRERPAPDAAKPPTEVTAPALPDVTEPPALAATRRTIDRARPDAQGLATAQGRGVVALKIAPASSERALLVLSHLFALAETHGHRSKATDAALVLVVDDELIAFGLEEQPQKTAHEPTAAELKRAEENARWGISRTPWPKYDHTPSGRLAIVIDANPYSGLRRTYGDGKTQSLEKMLPEVLAGFVEHAIFAKERRRAAEEQERRRQDEENRRQRAAAFEAREKRRMEFADGVHAQLVERSKLSTVLAYLEGAVGDDAKRISAVAAWVRRRIQQIDALISPLFLDISARSAKIDFEEPTGDAANNGTGDRYVYFPPVALHLWKIDETDGLARSRTALEWAVDAAAVPDPRGDD
jgi:hypothetical protein